MEIETSIAQYERAYRQAFVEAVKAVDPGWEIGKPIKAGVLDNITREDIERFLVQSGSKLVRKSVNYTI